MTDHEQNARQLARDLLHTIAFDDNENRWNEFRETYISPSFACWMLDEIAVHTRAGWMAEGWVNDEHHILAEEVLLQLIGNEEVTKLFVAIEKYSS